MQHDGVDGDSETDRDETLGRGRKRCRDEVDENGVGPVACYAVLANKDAMHRTVCLDERDRVAGAEFADGLTGLLCIVRGRWQLLRHAQIAGHVEAQSLGRLRRVRNRERVRGYNAWLGEDMFVCRDQPLVP